MRKLDVDQTYLQRVLLRLLDIPSPSGYTDMIVREVCGELDKLGVEYELNRRGAIRANLHGRQKDPDRAIVAHVDTIGAMVKRKKANGRLELVPVGTWSSRFAEGGRATVLSAHRQHRGTVLPLKASGHAYGDEVDTQPTGWPYVELRLDERVKTREDLDALAIEVGDYVAFDPATEITETGFVVSRHLDDKAGVACLMTAVKAVVESGVELELDCHVLFTISEEVGSGASAVLHQEVAEMVSIDNAIPAPSQESTEYDVTVAFKDSSGPYDYHLSHMLLDLARQHKIAARPDVFTNYHSDAASAVEAGNDIRTALLGFGVDAAHGYERTHVSSLYALVELIALYIQSPACVDRDRIDLGPLTGFPEQPV